MHEIAVRLEREVDTVSRWAAQGLLGRAPWTVARRPAWNWPDVEAWAREAGRLRDQGPAGRLPTARSGPDEYARVAELCAEDGGWSSIRQAAARLGVHPQKAGVLLGRAARMGVLEEEAAGKSRRYRVAVSPGAA